MSADTDWIKAALARDPTKTRAGIADALGLNRSAVTRLLSGERRLKFDEAQKIAAYLGAAPPRGLADRSRDFEGEATRGDDVAPIYRAKALAGGRWRLSRHEDAADWRPRAPHFRNAAKVFGFYAPDNAMAPRFFAGEIVWVDPARPVQPGDDALFVEKRRGKGPETVVLASLTRATATLLEGRQHGDGATVRVDARSWTALHVLPRY